MSLEEFLELANNAKRSALGRVRAEVVVEIPSQIADRRVDLDFVAGEGRKVRFKGKAIFHRKDKTTGFVTATGVRFFVDEVFHELQRLGLARYSETAA